MQFFKLLFLLLIGLFFVNCGSDDDSYFNSPKPTDINISIHGLVLEYDTNLTLEDVNITLDTNSSMLLTDLNGSYQLSLKSDSDYFLDISKPNYFPQTYTYKTTRELNQTLEIVYLIPTNTGQFSNASGYVTSSATSEFLQDVNVTIRSGINNNTGAITKSTLTDSNGKYEFIGQPVNATYTVEMSLITYETGYDTLSIIGGQTGEDQNFTISPIVQSIDGNNTMSGTVRSATTGIPLNDVNLSLRIGTDTKTGTISASSVTLNDGSADGTYSFDSLAAGEYTLEMSLNGYITGYANLTIIDGSSNNDKDYIISPELAVNQLMRFVLTWNDTPADLDGNFLITADDNSTHKLFYSDKNITVNGTTYATLDIDDTNGNGPETITVNYLSSGKYIYYIKNFSSGTDLNISNASVQIYEANGNTSVIDINVTGTGRFWEVFEINDSNITVTNRRTTTEPSL